jgi:hypothetical protein
LLRSYFGRFSGVHMSLLSRLAPSHASHNRFR